MKPLLYSVFKYFKPQNDLTLRTAFGRYLTDISPTKKSGAHAESSLVKVWLQTNLADMRLDRISAPHLVQLRDQWLTHFSPATVVRRLAIFSHLYTIARTEWGHPKLQNPVQSIRKPKVRNARDRRLLSNLCIPGYPTTELQWLLDFGSKADDWHCIITLAIETAMRRSELADLLWSNIDLDAGTAYLPDTKNGHDRTVPLSPTAIAALSEIYTPMAKGRVFQRSPCTITTMFVRARRRLRRKYEALCQTHGVTPNAKFFNDLRFHDLRHEAISRLAPHFQAHELARISGHRDTRMLMRYFHPNASEFATRLAALDQTSHVINSTSSIDKAA